MVVARHLAQEGKSSFDGFTLTNGYHPLWLALLTLQYKLFGQSLWLTRSVEYALGLGSLLFALRAVRIARAMATIIFTLGYYTLLNAVAFNGMETTLFAFCFAALTWRLLTKPGELASYGLLDGFLAAAAIAARIDAVVFILPQVLLAAHSRARKLVALGVISATGIIYGLVNRHFFGHFLPISGEIKSLGGLQFNHRLLQLLTRADQLEAQLFYAILLLGFFGIFLVARRRPGVTQSLVLAYIAGSFIFLVRLFFFSSWTIWVWYDYPLVIGYVCCVPFLLLLIEKKLEPFLSHKQSTVFAYSLATAVVLVGFLHTIRSHPVVPPGYFAVNKEAIDHFGSVLVGSRIAMGDRAGNFAFQYPGGVNQLEGLVNDDAYFRVLKQKGDIAGLLCQRDIHFIVAYEPDLGAYQNHEVQTIRFDLSQFAAPSIKVSHHDEVAKFSDLPKFNPHHDKVHFLYIWRLPCQLYNPPPSPAS